MRDVTSTGRQMHLTLAANASKASDLMLIAIRAQDLVSGTHKQAFRNLFATKHVIYIGLFK